MAEKERDKFTKFLMIQEEGSPIYAFVMNAVSITENHRTSDTVCFSDGGVATLGLMALIVGPILKQWAIDYLNARRRKQELDYAKEQIDLILKLEKEVYPMEIAKEIVEAVLGRIAKNNSHDLPALEQIVKKVHE